MSNGNMTESASHPRLLRVRVTAWQERRRGQWSVVSCGTPRQFRVGAGHNPYRNLLPLLRLHQKDYPMTTRLQIVEAQIRHQSQPEFGAALEVGLTGRGARSTTDIFMGRVLSFNLESSVGRLAEVSLP